MKTITCDSCGETVEKKASSVQYGDRNGVCLSCRPLFSAAELERQKQHLKDVPRLPHRERLTETTESPAQKLQRYLEVRDLEHDEDFAEVWTFDYEPLQKFLR